MKSTRISILGIFLTLLMPGVFAQFQMEDINRAVVAVDNNPGVYIGWRLLGTDPDTIAFNVYRGTIKLNSSPVTNSTNYFDQDGTGSDTYHIIPVLGDVEQTSSDTVSVWGQNYLTVPLQRPVGGTTLSGDYTYSPNDASIGDLDGDGEYEIVLKWDPSNSKDNSQSGHTGNCILDAYEMDGTHMWRIDLGINIRAGAHYTQFMVYDLTGDGMAEIACRTAPGSKDGSGSFLSDGPAASADHDADYRNSSGYILSGPEYLTVFNGIDGTEMVTTDFEPARGSVSAWGDSYGNRVDRFLGAILHLGGARPSLVFGRGIYEKMEIAAWDLVAGELVLRWHFKTQEGFGDWAGMGSHNLSIGDVDEDGKDEIIYGNCAIDDDGTGLWTLRSSIGQTTGDAGHLADIVPERPGLEKWGCGEGSGPGSFLVDARTGEVLWMTDPGDVGRATAGDLVPEFLGMECWGGTDGLRSSNNVRVGPNPSSTNHVVWWDGDLGRELLNDIYISDYQVGELLHANGCLSNNGTKSNPSLQADLFGDWREEVIWRTDDNSNLRIYTTTDTTDYRIKTLMHDPMYRLAVAWQNDSYNQPPHTSFYLGFEMFTPDSLWPPAAPSNLYSEDMNERVRLHWDDNIDLDLDGYWVYRSQSMEEGPFVVLNDTLLTESTYLDTNVYNDTSYYYYVTAVDTDGNESMPGNVILARPTNRPDYPVEVFTRSDSVASLVVWNEVTSDDIVGYNVYRSPSALTGFEKLNGELITDTLFIDSSPVYGALYYYYVVSVNDVDTESLISEIVTSQTGDTYTAQAEDQEIGGVVFLENEHIGFNGSGYVNFDGSGTTVTYHFMPGFNGGEYVMQFRYALGNTNRTGSLVVNGTPQSLTMEGTGAWTTYVTDSAVIVLEEGFANTIRFESTGSDFGNLDQITIKRKEFTEGPGEVPIISSNSLNGVRAMPNPFVERVTLSYEVFESGNVSIMIYNNQGQRVSSLVDEKQDMGEYQIDWDPQQQGGNLIQPGVYYGRIISNSELKTIKLLYLKVE